MPTPNLTELQINLDYVCRITCTDAFDKGRVMQMFREKTFIERVKYCIFCIKWSWKNRTWDNTRQKFKAMEKAWRKERRDT